MVTVTPTRRDHRRLASMRMPLRRMRTRWRVGLALCGEAAVADSRRVLPHRSSPVGEGLPAESASLIVSESPPKEASSSVEAPPRGSCQSTSSSSAELLAGIQNVASSALRRETSNNSACAASCAPKTSVALGIMVSYVRVWSREDVGACGGGG